MAKEFVLPDIGEGLVDAEIVRWHVAVGDVVTEEQVLVEVETAKAVVELPSPYAGTVLALAAAEGATVDVGAPLVVIGEEGELGSVGAETADVEAALSATDADSAPPVPTASPVPPSDGPVKAMPVVRKLARDHGIDLADVAATGPGGRTTRGDVEAAIAAQGPTPATDAVVTRPASSPPLGGDDERVPLPRVRRTIADHMARSWSEIPHVTVFDRVDGTRLLDARAALMKRLERGVPLEAFIVKAVVPVLTEFREFNATLDGDELIYRGAINVAVAVDTPHGLLVPVVRHADRLSLAEIAERIDELAGAVRDRSATPDDLSGGTFTVSNIGALGGGYGTPIIPHGTTAILSVGRASPAPIVAGDGSIKSAPLVPLSLSYDHRVIDGAVGQRFLARLMENLEQPALFLA